MKLICTETLDSNSEKASKPCYHHMPFELVPLRRNKRDLFLKMHTNYDTVPLKTGFTN